MLTIQVGQQWRMRNGEMVRVTADRGEGLTWRWALSNGQIADENGLVGFGGVEDPHDLMQLQEHQK